MLARRDRAVCRIFAGPDAMERPVVTAVGIVASVLLAALGQFADRWLNLHLINDFEHAGYPATTLDA